MKISNLMPILPLLNFEEEGDFYHIQVIARKKDNPDLGKNARHLHHYYIESKEHLCNMFAEMIVLTEFHNARLMINLNKRNHKKLAMKTIKKIIEQIESGSEAHAKNAFASVCGANNCENKSDKKWIVDIDVTDAIYLQSMVNTIDICKPYDVRKHIVTIPTQNGFHIITKAFDVREFYSKGGTGGIDIHKDNPTLLYSNLN